MATEPVGMETFYQQMNEHQVEAEKLFDGGGGGGVIAECQVEAGYKVFAPGTAQEDSWFPFSLGDTEAHEQAQTLAQKFATDHNAFRKKDGVPTNRMAVSLGIVIIARMDKALSGGQPVQWQGDRHLFTPMPEHWMSVSLPNAFRDVVAPSLAEHGITSFPWVGWCRISNVDNPYKVSQGEAGMTETYEDKPRFPQTFYVGDVYESEDAAKAKPVTATSSAAEVELDQSVGLPGPDWAWADFLDTAPVLRDEAKAGKTATKLAAEYGLSLPAVLVALGAHITPGVPPMVAKTFGVAVADIAAAKTLAEQIAGILPK